MMHFLIGAKPGMLSTFFSLVKKRLCSPELKHCLNVYSVVLCTLGTYIYCHLLYDTYREKGPKGPWSESILYHQKLDITCVYN